MLPVLPTMRFPEAGGVRSVLMWQTRSLAQTTSAGMSTIEAQIFAAKLAGPAWLNLRNLHTSAVPRLGGLGIGVNGASGQITVPGAGSNSEHFGASSAAAGADSVAVGNAASAPGTAGTVVGAGTTLPSGADISAFGQGMSLSAPSSLANSTLMGQGITLSTTGSAAASVFIGEGISVTNATAANLVTMIGQGISFAGSGTATRATAIGQGITFGSGATATSDSVLIGQGISFSNTGAANNNVLIGRAITVSSSVVGCSNNVLIGRAISVDVASSVTNSVAIGDALTVAASGFVCIGRNTSIAGSASTTVGASSTATGNNSCAYGQTSSATGAQSMAFGQGATSAFTGSMAFGSNAATTENNQFVCGSGDSGRRISNVFFGGGVTSTAANAYTINGTGGSGTDVAGSNITIAGGKGTGNALSGQIVFQTSTAGSSGTTLQSLATRGAWSATNFHVGATITTPSGATQNIVLGGAATSPVLGAATADIVSLAAVDTQAGQRDLYIQTETGGPTRIGADSISIPGGTNGQYTNIRHLTELTTIAAAAFTDTAIQIPANAIVLAVSVRVTVAIPTAATFTVTGATSATQFDAAGGVAVAANTTDVGTRNCPYNNAAVQSIRLTPDLAPAANTGRVRVTIHYIDVTPATS